MCSYQNRIAKILPPPVVDVLAGVEPKAGAAPKALVAAVGLNPPNGDDVVAPELNDPTIPQKQTNYVSLNFSVREIPVPLFGHGVDQLNCIQVGDQPTKQKHFCYAGIPTHPH